MRCPRPVPHSRWLPAILALALAVTVAACGQDGDGSGGGEEAGGTEDVPDGPAITVASFDFPESSILAEIYAQTLEEAGYPVERELDLGTRELILPELETGTLDLLPEYVGSSLMTGFEQEAPDDLEEGVEALREEFAALGVEVLEPAPAENTNVFVVTEAFADEHGVTSIADLGDVDEELTVAGAPECEDRTTCFVGLTDLYGLDNLRFESVQEAAARVEALDAGQADVILLFSTDAVLGLGGLQVLEDPEGMVPPENVVPVLHEEIVEAYGDQVTDLLDEVSADLTTQELVELNVEADEGRAPGDIAADWLERR